MLEVICNAIIATFINLVIWYKILGEKPNYRKCKTYLGIVFMLISLIINSIMVEPIVKTIIVLMITFITIEIIYDVNLKDAIILSIFTQLIYIISEVLIVTLLLIVTNIRINTELVEKFSGTIYTNIIIDIIVFIVAHLKIVRESYYKITSLIKSENIQNIFILVFTIISTATLLFNLIFFENNLLLLSFVGLIALLVYLVFITKSIIMRNNYLKMYSKYNSTLETLKSYEEIMDKYKVSNHENKNQLLMIRNMLGKDTKSDVGEYIDNIVENEYKDDENLIMETSKIPSGGLRALIYSKLLYMKNNKINFDLKVDRKIRSIELVDLDQNMILDICKITGVFLDNAIEELNKIKNGSISVELYILKDKFHISIANTFEGLIDLDKIDEVKYTTKGNGHGYGLSLVKEIVSKNPKLENVRMINDNVFIQVLKIDI